MTDARYRIHHPNEPRFKPVKPKLKDDSSIDLYKINLVNYQTVMEALTVLDSVALASVGPTIQQELFDVETGHLEVTVTQIVQHVWETYGVRSVEDLRLLNKRLRDAFSATVSFVAQVTNMAMTFAILDNAGQSKSEFDKCEFLVDATSFIPTIVKCIEMFNMENLDVKARTFKALVAFIRIRAPRINPTASGFVGHAGTVPLTQQNSTSAAAAFFQTLSPAEQTAAMAGFAANMTAAMAGFAANMTATNKAAGNRPQTPAAAVPAAAKNSELLYCFRHAYGSHAGKDCANMRTKNEKFPGFFTVNQINATAPAFIDGHMGKR